jgi:hypothetical protein
MPFDVAEALKAGYSQQEIATFLGEQKKFDTQKAFESGYSPDEVISFLNPKEQTTGERLKRAAVKGFEAIPESAAGIGLGVSSALGLESTGKQAEAIRKEAKKEAELPQGITWDELEKTYGTEGAFAALKKLPTYVAEQILQSAPSMAIPLAAGAAGAALSGPLAPIVGPLTGIGAYGVQQFGSFMQRQAQEGATPETLAPGKAALAAAATAPIGYFADRFTLGMSKVPTKVLGEEISKELAKRTSGVAGRAATGASLGIIAEAPTEVLEQAAERWQAGLDLTGEEAKKEYKEAFFGAAAVGGVGGAAARVLRGAPPEPEVAPPPVAPPPYAPEPSITGTNTADMIAALSRPQNADMMAAIRGREEEQAAQAEAQRVEEERAAAETKRLEEEAQRVETARQMAARERVRAMPGFTGADTTNADILQAVREKQEAEAIALEKGKEIEYRKILGTTFSADPLQNFRQQQAAIDRLDYTTPEMKKQIPDIYDELKALSEEPDTEAPPVTPPVTTVTPPVTPIAPPVASVVEPIAPPVAAPIAPPVAPPVVAPGAAPVAAPIAPPVAPPVIEEQQPIKQDKSLASQPTYTESTVLEVPVPELTLSKDVPQFKSDANQNGVVQATKLEGKFDRRLASPVQVWQRNNGQLEVISGRHRLDLAQRSGEKTIPAQIYKESEGFNADMARMLDIELNVKDGRGKVKDYVSFFKEFGLPKEQARAEGLLNTAIGRQAYEIADAGSPSLIAAHFNKDITDDAATAIAINAPRDEALQNLGMQQVRDGKSINHAVNFMRSAMAAGFKGKEGSGDLFGFDDSFAKEAEAVTKEATKQQREARQQLSAIKGAAKSPEKARLGGVDVKNLEQTQAKIAELEKTINELENFHTNPELYKKLRQAAGLEVAEVAPAVEEITTPAEEASEIKDLTIRDKLKRIAKNIGVKVFETGGGYSAGSGVVSIPTEDRQVEGAQTPEHVFAHELGHAVMQNRQMSYNGMPNVEVEKWIKGWSGIKNISKSFRPEMHKHPLPKFKRHANKPDEIIADALGSFFLGESSRQDIQPIIEAMNLNDFDLGLKEKPSQELVSPTPEALKAQEERAKSEEKRIAAEKKASDDKAKADAEVGEYKLAGSDRAADQDSDQEAMFSLLGKSEKQITAFEQSLRTLLNKFGLKDVGLKLSEGMRDEGSYAAKLIQIAADSASPIRTLRHEAIHALRELGFFTEGQWKSLSKMAKDKWIDQYLKQRNVDGKPLKAGEESRYDAYMREYKGDMEKITEEAVADAFADFESTKPPAGMLQSLLKRLSNLFQSIKSALTKIEAPEQIFAKVEKGALKPEAERAPSESKSLRTSVESLKESAQKFLQTRQPLDREALSHVQDEDFKDALGTVFNPQRKTVIDKVEGMKDGFWRRVAQGVADQYRTIKDYDPVSYMLARLSKTVDGALEGLMLHGHVFNDGGALNIRQNTKGMLEALKPLGKEVDSYQMWIALNRESKLPPEKRSPNISALVPNKDLLVQGTLNGKPRLEVYQSVQKDKNALNKSVLDVALNAGIINSSAKDIAAIRNRTDLTDQQKQDKIDKIGPGAYEIFSNDIFYIPFYKEMEDGDVQSSASAAGLDRQKFSAELKGMTDKPFGDLMENTLRNWSHILSASMKNQAANSTINATMKAGATIPNMKVGLAYRDGVVYSTKNDEVVGDGVLRPEQTSSEGKGMVKIMRDGHPMYFEVLDPMLLESIISIGYMGPKSKFLEVARDFKNVLQFGVTISPTFKVNNLIRDSISAMAVSALKKTPWANVAEGWAASRKNNPAHISALAGGAVFNFGSTYEGDQAKLIKQLIKQGVRPDSILDSPEKIKAGMKLLWNKYQEFGNRSEAANRLALYNQLRADRKDSKGNTVQGMSHMEASFQARDLLDFSMQGSWQAFRTVTMVVPFLNARVQGLYKLGRDGITPTTRVLYNTVTGKEITASDRQKAYSFSVTTSAVALASMALYMAFKDDEDFQKRDEWDRDNFWWIKIPGMEYALRVPKPFEVGAFGTLAERTLEQIVDQGSEGKQFGSSIGRMLFDTFALNPTPQMFKPLIDLYANKDSFTGAPIESAGMERLSKQERATDTTSPIAKLVGGMSSFLGEKGELSPVQVDYAIKSYFGWLGATAATTSMYATMPFREGAYPDTVWMDKASLGLIKTLPSNQSRYTTAFYESNKDISQAFADMRHFAEAGESEKVERILEEKGDKIALAKFYDKTAKSMANIRKQIRMITNDESMSGADKREEIDRMKEIISMLSKQAEDTRKAMK